MDNKVKFGLENVHYAPILEALDGSLSFGTPIPHEGAVSISLDPQGDPLEFYADNKLYYSEDTNNGYDTELEVADLTDIFRQIILGEEYNNGVLYENVNQQSKKFALLFQFEGDKKAKRHVLYYCSASRPKIEGSTKSEKPDVQTTKLSLRSRPHPVLKQVKASTTLDATNYDTWYDAVPIKPATVAATGVTLTPDTANLAVGATQQLTVAMAPVGATNPIVIYKTSNPAVATVSVSGLITAVTVGSATITVTSIDGGFTDTCTVTVA